MVLLQHRILHNLNFNLIQNKMLADVEKTHILAIQWKWQIGSHILNFIYPHIYD